jgi:predicted metalloenzyme YecM
MQSEILVESKTLNLSTPKSSIKTQGTKSSKSVRINEPDEEHDVQKTPTAIVNDLKKIYKLTPFSKRVPFKSVLATSTPK